VSFLHLLHAEWTKFRTVLGWLTGTVAAGLMLVLVASLAGVSSRQDSPPVPVGPGGEPVSDTFYLVHRPLTGDGSITVPVSALSSAIPARPHELRPGVVPWAKAGLIIKQSTRPGSPYVAVMVTPGHGVRMQHDFVHDTAGPPGAVPAGSVRWLRLARSGATVTGSASADGTHWTEVGTVPMALGPTAPGGLFVASPPVVQGMGTVGTVSTAGFGEPRLQGRWTGGTWTGEQVGIPAATFAGYPGDTSGSFTSAGRGFTVTGAGDIAPAVRATLPTSGTLAVILTGTFPALVVVIVLGALYITTEYRERLIHATLAAVPGRRQVLVAKAIVLGAVNFAAGLAGTLIAAPLGERLARANGVYLFPVPPGTGLRVALGTAALLAAASILALSIGAVVRHGAAAVSIALAAIVLPYLLIANPFMPAGVGDLVARVTPAAAFAVQQTLLEYPQVEGLSTPYQGYYPLAPWAGLAVLAGYALAGLALAAVLLRRRDA
jgi:hypothetical protein